MTTSFPAILWQYIAQEPSLSSSLHSLLPLMRANLNVIGLSVVTLNAERSETRILGNAGLGVDDIDLKDEYIYRWMTDASQDNASIVTLANNGEPAIRRLGLKLRSDKGYYGFAIFSCNAQDVLTLSQRISEFHALFATAMTNHLQVAELKHLHNQVASQREDLLHRMGRDEMKDEIVGAHQGLANIMYKVALVAPSDSTALILGETGSGKELIARAIHQQSARKQQPFVRINCGALPPELIDSELFGHERGSFTGAAGLRRGWFERADGGTLFLDEIGELPPAAQVRLLRVIQEGTLLRVGGEQELQVNVRIIAATHRNLTELVKQGLFREDLWYRLNVFPLYLPSLRERPGDIPALADHFTRRAAKKLGLPFIVLTAEQLFLLARYDWPGNVREMQVVIERAAILGRGKTIELQKALGEGILPIKSELKPANIRADHPDTLDNIIITGIKRALDASNGRVEGQFGAARILAINPNTLRSKMRKYKIDVKRIVSEQDQR